jgi:hypothetical protein
VKCHVYNVSVSDVGIEVEEIAIKGCGGIICKRIPGYRKVKGIIINKK